MTDQSLKTCVDWLIRCSVLPKDHWLASGNAQLTDLVHHLKDGVLLCHLLIRLHPSAMDPKNFSQRPQMSQFLCQKNIRVFLQACKNVFRMKDDDLFDIQILFNPGDNRMFQVLKTLSVLSRTQPAQRSGIAPFTVSDTCDYMNMKAFSDIDYVTEDGLERKGDGIGDTSYLDTENDNHDANDFGSYDAADGDDIYQNNNNDHDKSIYDDLFSVQHYLAVSQDAQPKTKRDMCIQELVETEKKYVDVLSTIKNSFMTPLKQLQNLLPTNEYDKVFFGINKLTSAHTEFKSSLLQACECTSALSIPDCFVMCKEKFLFYGEYCANLTLAQETIDRLCLVNSVLNSKIMELELAANEGRFKMRDMLSIPMQRVLKYHLLLKELINNTKEDHPERKMLERALEETQDLSLFVNEVKRDREMLSSINLVSASIVDLPKSTHLEEAGRLLMDGEMKVRMSTENGIQTRHIFLFDKVLIVCKSLKGENYMFRHAFVLNYYDIATQVTKEKGQCSITLTEKNRKDSFMILAKKEETLKKWIEVIQLAQDNENPLFAQNEKHNFKMWTFEKPTICDVCRKLLRGVFFQGYRCERTKMNVHKECLKIAKDMDGPPTGTIPPKRVSVKSPSATSKVLKTTSSYRGSPSPGFGRSALSFDAGETVEVMSDNDPEWIEGELHGKRGFFPRKFVWDRAPSYERPHTLPRRESAPVTPSYFPTLPHFPTRHSCGNSSDNMESYPWYAGMLSRDLAIDKLNPLPDGSYLIRISERSSSIAEYAISIKFSGKVMHMKISRDQEGKFFLGARTKFDSLPQLIDHYQQVPLDKVYPDLSTVLAIPFRNALRPGRQVIGQCVVKFDYSATEPNQLSLRTGEIITIVSKAEEGKGWWKGESRNGKVGNFPYTYVIEVEKSRLH